MRLFYDTRLNYFVSAPGSENQAGELIGKAGDTTLVEIQFGYSTGPTFQSTIIEAQTWTPINLDAGTTITIGLKEYGQYGDGPLLASSSTFTNDAGLFTYYFDLPLNTTAINTALGRNDSNDANDIPSLGCAFEITYKLGGAGGDTSSILPVLFTLYNDVLIGGEGTPTNADNPDEYSLRDDVITYVRKRQALQAQMPQTFTQSLQSE